VKVATGARLIPLLPTCKSQNKAFPKAIAAFLSLTNSPKFGGSETATVLSEASASDGSEE
jgi:hypothetical protein